MPIIVDPDQPQSAPPTTATSADGRLKATVDSNGRGVLLTYDGSGLSTVPTRVTVTRDDDVDVAVRSGDPALAPGGIAVIYDHEAPFGVGLSYTATPDSGGPQSIVNVMVTQPFDSIGLEGLWVKDVNDPDRSLVCEVVSWDPLKYGASIETASVLGSPYPVSVGSSVNAAASSVVLRTRGQSAYRALAQLLRLPGYGTNPVPPLFLLDPHLLFMRPRNYAIVTAATPKQEGPIQNGMWRWTLQYQSVARPDPTGATLRIPGRSYADLARIYTAYSDIPQSNATYLEVATG